MSKASKAPSVAPVVVEVQRPEGRLRIVWEDDHESLYGWRYLRGFCPCAHCQGHGHGLWKYVPNAGPAVTRIEEAGAYALIIAFADGHDTGIYTFEILRELCPCADCVAARGGEHAMKLYPADGA